MRCKPVSKLRLASSLAVLLALLLNISIKEVPALRKIKAINAQAIKSTTNAFVLDKIACNKTSLGILTATLKSKASPCSLSSLLTYS